MQKPIISPLNQSLQHLFNAPQTDATIQPATSYKFIFKTGLFALLSAVVYFAAAIPAGERYVNYATIDTNTEKNKTSWFFIWTTAVCAGLTMVVFNWEVYFHKWQHEKSWLNYLSGCIKEFFKMPIHVLFALTCGINNILPLWYVSLKKNIFWNMLMTLSTSFSSITFYDGVQVCYDVANYPEVQLFFLKTRLLLSCITNESEKELKDQIEWTTIKKILWEKLEKNQDAFYYSSDIKRQTFANSEQQNTLQHYLQGSGLSTFDATQNHCCILSIGYKALEWLLWMAAWIQHAGFTIGTYMVGNEWGGPSLGIILALFGTIPGVGFTIKGILGEGILGALNDAYHGRSSQMHRLLPNYIFVSDIIMHFVCALSGFDADTLSYLSAKFLGCNEPSAITLGVIANIGCALVFNFSQYHLLKMRLEESLVLLEPTLTLFHPQIRLQAAFRNFCEQIRKSPLEEIKMFVEENKSVVLPFFKNQNFTVLTRPDLSSKTLES